MNRPMSDWRNESLVNEIHRAEREEGRYARQRLTELQRATGCRHRYARARYGAICVDCGDAMSMEEL